MNKLFTKNNSKILVYFSVFFLSISFAPTVSITSYNIFNSPLQYTTERKSDTMWIYKTIDGKKYKRLYNEKTKEWLTDWILV